MPLVRPRPPVPRRSLAALAAALVVGVSAAVVVGTSGGVAGFREQYGALAPLVSFPVHVALTLTPIGEAVPFGAANGAVYGVAWGSALNWAAWMVAALAQRAVGAGAAREVGRVPGWLSRWPLTHPVVLVVGRWPPGGSVLVDAAAGAAGVPVGRHLLLAGLGHAPQAVALAAVGAGLLRLL